MSYLHCFVSATDSGILDSGILSEVRATDCSEYLGGIFVEWNSV